MLAVAAASVICAVDGATVHAHEGISVVVVVVRIDVHCLFTPFSGSGGHSSIVPTMKHVHMSLLLRVYCGIWHFL